MVYLINSVPKVSYLISDLYFRIVTATTTKTARAAGAAAGAAARAAAEESSGAPGTSVSVVSSTWENNLSPESPVYQIFIVLCNAIEKLPRNATIPLKILEMYESVNKSVVKQMFFVANSLLKLDRLILTINYFL